MDLHESDVARNAADAFQVCLDGSRPRQAKRVEDQSIVISRETF